MGGVIDECSKVCYDKGAEVYGNGAFLFYPTVIL